ncbi:MAG: MBL fold metallo-hydrolase [bacterium]
MKLKELNNDKYSIAFTTFALVLVFLANIFFWYGFLRESHGGKLYISYLDIGQGDASYIETPNGGRIVIDGGPGNALMRALGKVMPFYNRKIDIVILTNPDEDHLSGLIDLCKRYEISLFIESGTKAVSASYKALKECLALKKVPVIFARRGMSFPFDDGVNIKILFPDRDASPLKKNDGSTISLISYKKDDFYFMGDAPRKMERYLMALGDMSTSTKLGRESVLKLGHHGSKTSSDEKFLRAISPHFAIISAGLNNKYHHPSPETLETLKNLNLSYFRTDEVGTINITSDGQSIWKEK